jgi:ABC-type iron transport system FetAB ATPase subunit
VGGFGLEVAPALLQAAEAVDSVDNFASGRAQRRLGAGPGRPSLLRDGDGSSRASDVLRVDYLAVPGLPLLSFEVAAGECLTVEGPSGSGKTRLLRAIADLDPAGGYVHLEGVERGEMAGPQWRKRVRYVAAEPAWWGDTAREHLVAGSKAERWLAALGLDAGQHLDRSLSELSTGERQRLGLVRALLDEPAVLLLDEPTSALDTTTGAMVEEVIRYHLLAERIVLLVSHDAAQIERLAHAHLQLAEAPAAPRSESAAA